MSDLLNKLKTLDDKLSHRYIELDPAGYWIIYVDVDAQCLGVKHYSNTIDEKGLACDPDTGEVIPCNAPVERQPTLVLMGQTAKELCITLFEALDPCPVTRLDHAAYLGRELVRAEVALVQGLEYIQD